jgi:hypothetical protein
MDIKKYGLEEWLKWCSTSLASMRPRVQIPMPPKIKIAVYTLLLERAELTEVKYTHSRDTSRNHFEHQLRN